MAHSVQQMQQLQTLVNKYNGIDKVPPLLLKNAGFSNQSDAFNAMINMGGQAYGSPVSAITNAPLNAAKGIGKAITNIGLANVVADVNGINHPALAGSGASGQLPYIPSNALAIGGPQNPSTAGSGINTNAPALPGGVSFGQPGGSTLGASNSSASSPYPPAGTGSTYDEQVPQGGSGTDPIGNAAPDWSTYMKGYGADTKFAPIPIAPKPVPLVLNDFTPQAQKDASAAYSPAFQAIEQAKSDAQNNYNVANAVVGGIYANLGKTIGSNFDALDTKMGADKVAIQKDNTAAQTQMANTYGSSGVQMADELKRQGLGQYAASVMKPANDQLAFQSGQLAQTGQNTLNTLQSNKTTGDTYGTNLQNASATQGAYSQQQLAFDLASTLSGINQNKLNLSTDEANRVLDLANTLSTQDLGLQQGNAAQTQQYYQNQLGAATAQNSSISAGLQQDYQQRQDAYNNAYQQYKDNTNWTLAAQQEADSNSQASATLAERAREFNSGQTSAHTTTGNTGPYGTFQDEVTNILTTNDSNGQAIYPAPTAVRGYTDAIDAVMQKYTSQGTTPSAQQFVQDAVQAAAQYGVDPATMQDVAWAYLGSGAGAGVTGAKTL